MIIINKEEFCSSVISSAAGSKVGVSFAPGVSEFQMMAFRWQQNIVYLNVGFYTIGHVQDEHIPGRAISNTLCIPPGKKIKLLRGWSFFLVGIGLWVWLILPIFLFSV